MGLLRKRLYLAMSVVVLAAFVAPEASAQGTPCTATVTGNSVTVETGKDLGINVAWSFVVRPGFSGAILASRHTADAKLTMGFALTVKVNGRPEGQDIIPVGPIVLPLQANDSGNVSVDTTVQGKLSLAPETAPTNPPHAPQEDKSVKQLALNWLKDNRPLAQGETIRLYGGSTYTFRDGRIVVTHVSGLFPLPAPETGNPSTAQTWVGTNKSFTVFFGAGNGPANMVFTVQ